MSASAVSPFPTSTTLPPSCEELFCKGAKYEVILLVRRNAEAEAVGFRKCVQAVLEAEKFLNPNQVTSRQYGLREAALLYEAHQKMLASLKKATAVIEQDAAAIADGIKGGEKMLQEMTSPGTPSAKK